MKFFFRGYFLIFCFLQSIIDTNHLLFALKNFSFMEVFIVLDHKFAEVDFLSLFFHKILNDGANLVTRTLEAIYADFGRGKEDLKASFGFPSVSGFRVSGLGFRGLGFRVYGFRGLGV